MTLTLDSVEYLLGQPMLVSVAVSNAGPERFQDMASLEPELGYLALVLKRQGQLMREVGPLDTRVFFGEGLTLRNGETACRLINLVDRFGGIDQTAGGNRSVGDCRVIPVGEYKLTAKFTARLGLIKGLPQVVLNAAPVRFIVRERPTPTNADAIILEVVQRPQDRTRALDAVRTALDLESNGRPSPGCITLAAQMGLIPEAVIPSKALAEGAKAFGLNRLQEAAILGWRYGSIDGGSAARRAWIKKLTSKRNSPEVTCLLHSLERMLGERAKYRTD